MKSPDRLNYWLHSYRPSDAATKGWSPALQQFVLVTMERVGPTDDAIGRRLARVLTLYGRWLAAQGVDLQSPFVFDPELVESFARSGMPDSSHRSTYRSALRKIAPGLSQPGLWLPPGEKVAARSASVPYSAAELTRLAVDVEAQATAGRRRAGTALLALGLGAGLDGRWNIRVTGNDVVEEAGVVCVVVGEPSRRVVPVRREYATQLVRLAACGGEPLVGPVERGRNAAGNLQRRIVVSSGTPVLNAGRLRATWVVRHLADGTRLPELLDAAGLRGLRTITSLLGHLEPLDPQQRLEMLAGYA